MKQAPVAGSSQMPRGAADGTRPDRVRATGVLLRSLLLQREGYLRQWQPARRRTAPGLLSQAAVADVIARHLWDTGERPDTEISLPRGLKDRVHRALRGEVISTETLAWFIGAFAMTAEDADRLRAALYGDQPPSCAAVTGTLRHPAELPLPQRHRTVAVFERRIIGAARHVVAHRTTRAITACAGPVLFYPCRQFSRASAFTVLRGGSVTARHERTGTSPILEITLSTPLQPGQVASLEYQADFGPESGPAVEYRQVAHARADNVDIVIQFHPASRPRGIWWATWDDYRGGAILSQEPASLDADGCVHRFLPCLENAAAGFRWEW